LRIGIHPPTLDRGGTLLDAAGLAERAQMVEAADLDGIWLGDHTPVAGDVPRDHPEPFMTLLVAALATTRIEVGTAVYGLPIRNPADVAMHLYTVQTYAPGRFSFGVGTGSSELEYEIAGVAWERRFARLHDHLDHIRAIFDGKPEARVAQLVADSPRPGYGAGQAFDEATWPVKVGKPRFLLGAWFSGPQLRRAATDFDGWIASAGTGSHFGGWVKVRESMRRFRDLGGKRAILGAVTTDLRAPSSTLPDDGAFDLRCGPEEAAERLHLLEEIGFDDVILNISDSTSPLQSRMGHRYDFTSDDLEQYRSLLPKDPRDYRRA